MDIQGYQKKYCFLYEALQKPEIKEGLERIVFPTRFSETPLVENAKSIAEYHDRTVGNLSDFLHEHTGQDVEDVLKALVAYGDMKPEYGCMLAESWRRTSSKRRLRGHPALQKIANALLFPVDVLKGVTALTDEDWLELNMQAGRHFRRPGENTGVPEERQTDHGSSA